MASTASLAMAGKFHPRADNDPKTVAEADDLGTRWAPDKDHKSDRCLSKLTLLAFIKLC